MRAAASVKTSYRSRLRRPDAVDRRRADPHQGVFVALGAPAAWADDTQEALQLVERARLTFESFSADPTLGENLRILVNKAREVLPQILRGAFIFGVAAARLRSVNDSAPVRLS